MMLELSIRFTSDETQAGSPISVSLFRPDTGAFTPPAPFNPPLGDPELADLRWYLEVFSTWPTGPDYERAERTESRLEAWGRALRDSLLSGTDAARLWQQFMDAAAEGKLLTLDATDPRVLRLPWELLADESGHLFAQGAGLRRRLQKSVSTPPKPLALPVRLLVVVARPEKAGFIDPRSDSRALLDALEGLDGQAEVEFLYPPTLKALTARLRERQAPPVHIVHFDGHGVYDSVQGLGYLLFEDERHGGDPVDAQRLGTLLQQCGIPLMVLSACQSATQETVNPYASVAARLIRAGVGSVLAMNYSVLVSAAKKFVAAFYGGLTTGQTIGQAVDAGRFELLADAARHSLTRRSDNGDLVEETIRLRDWFLPALYQQAADPVVFPTRAGEQGGSGAAESPLPRSPAPLHPRALSDPTAPGGLPDEPRHGFHGRARELLLLERALAEHAIVVLHGFGGLGKTALSAEAGRWFYRTGRFRGGAAFVSFEHGGSLSQLCSWVGQAVSGDPNFMLGQGDPVQRVADLLADHPALLILDNFESVLGRDPLMPPEELKAVLDAVWLWAAGSPRPLGEGPGVRASRTTHHAPRLLITTRDTTLNDPRFSPSRACAHLALPGLAPGDALELAGAILDDYGLERAAVSRLELLELLDRLGGHPLSLYLVLPHLRQFSPAQLTARFEELLPGFTSGAAKERNDSLAVSLEFSLRRLGDATRAALPDLAVFQGGCFESHLLHITQIDPGLWQSARAELEQAALVTVETLPNINNPFLRFHPTLLPYLAGQLPAERRAALEERYWQRYYALANYLYESDTQHPHEARTIASRELPNLRRAFDLALAETTADHRPPTAESGGPSGGGQPSADGGPSGGGQPSAVSGLPGGGQPSAVGGPSGGGQPSAVGGLPGGGQPSAVSGRDDLTLQVVNFATAIAKFLDNFGRWREREAVQEKIKKLDIRNEKGITQAEFLRLDGQGEALLQQGRAAEAERLFRELLARLEAGAAYDAAYHEGTTLMRLGRCLATQGRPTQAIEFHRRALERMSELANERMDESAKGMVGVIYADLADNLMAVGQFGEAQENYESGLTTSKESENQRQVGVILGQLGKLALRRGDLAEAGKRYREALDTFRALGEPQVEAVAWHQLGVVAQEAKEWAEAERCYRESLKLKESMRDLPGVARTCNQLALVAKGAGRLDEAERWYLRAQEIKDQISPQDASTLNNLADLYLGQGRLAEAEQSARRAAAIKETLDLSAEPWATYSILAQIAQAQGRAEESAQWRRQEQESYAAYAGSSLAVQKWAQEIAIVVAACQGNTQAQELAEQIIRRYQDSQDWGKLVATFRRILSGEHDLEALRVGLDRTDFVIIRTVLGQLGGGSLDPSPNPSPLRGGGQEQVSARRREQWGQVIEVLVAACGGHAGAVAEVGPFLEALAQQPDWVNLAAALRRLLAGERAPAALFAGLDDTDRWIVGEILRGLEAGGQGPTSPPLAGEGPGEGSASEGMTLDDLLNLVATACGPEAPAGLGAQLHGFTQTLSTDSDVSPGERALGRVLNHILSGERAPDMSALPPAVADKIRALLVRLAG